MRYGVSGITRSREHSTGPAHFRLRLEEFNGGENSLRNNRGVLFGIFPR